VLPVRYTRSNAGLAFRQGVVRHIESRTDTASDVSTYQLFNHILVENGSTAIGMIPGAHPSSLASGADACESGERCVRAVADTGPHLVYTAARGSSTLVDGIIDGYTSHYQLTVPAAVRAVDAGASYVVLEQASPPTRYVVNLGHGQIVRTEPAAAASLWFQTLWSATTTPGRITSVDLATNTAGQVVDTGSDCVPTELQSTQRWLYWTCGTDGPAGVYDLPARRNIPVGAGQVLLGDGYLVRHDRGAGALRLTDFHAGTEGAPVKVADLPAGTVADQRGVGFAVDRNGRGLAYVDADNAVHVVDSGVPATPVAAASASSSWAAYARDTGPYANFTYYPVVTRPITTWTMEIRRANTGELVNSQNGSAAVYAFTARWDGRLPNGQLATNDLYRWRVTATAVDGDKVDLGHGNVNVVDGVYPFRSYDASSGPSLLGVKSNGEGYWYNGVYGKPGALVNNGYTDQWWIGCSASTCTTAIVPFGDFNGDGRPDLITRDGAGVLHAWLGFGQSYFGSNKQIVVGKGWQVYRSLTWAGDLNHDGIADLLAVDGTGVLWLYTGNGKGAFHSRVKIGAGWLTYTRLIGTGDLNGDGNGDLLGVDKYGYLYRYNGTGKSTFTARTAMGGGWNQYTALIGVGDLSQDGRNDLIARDKYGVLWRYDGRGTGTFNARVKQGTNWNTYTMIY
jgi:hypothetical protein